MNDYTKNLRSSLIKLNSEFIFEYISEDHSEFRIPDYRLSRMIANIEEFLPKKHDIVISIQDLQKAIDFADKTYHNTTIADPEWVKCLKYKLFGANWEYLEETK